MIKRKNNAGYNGIRFTWIVGYLTRCGFCYLFVKLLPIHTSFNLTFIGMDIKSIVKIFFLYETVSYKIDRVSL